MILFGKDIEKRAKLDAIELTFNDAMLVCEAIEHDASATIALLETLHWATMQVRRAYPESEPRPVVLTDDQRLTIAETLRAAHRALVDGLDAQGAPRGTVGGLLAESPAFEIARGALREKGHGRELWRLREHLHTALDLFAGTGEVSILE